MSSITYVKDESLDEKLLARRILSLILILSLLLPLFEPLIVYGAGGVEYNSVDVWLPDELKNKLMIYNVPLNVSQAGIVTENNLYVLDHLGQPYYSFLFSSIPPVASVIDPASNLRLWSFIYGGTNPYDTYIASPDQLPIYAVYDDFDYDSGMWKMNNTDITGSSLNVLKNGYASLNTTYTSSVSMWILRIAGQTSYLIKLENKLDEPITGWIAFKLDNTSFNAWGEIQDLNKILFVTETNHPLPYMVLEYEPDKPEMILAVFIENLEPNQPKTVYMLFNKEEGSQYQVSPTDLMTPVIIYNQTITSGDALNYTVLPYKQSVEHITGYSTDTNIHLLNLPANTFILITGNNTVLYTNKTNGEPDHTIPYNLIQNTTNTTITVIPQIPTNVIQASLYTRSSNIYTIGGVASMYSSLIETNKPETPTITLNTTINKNNTNTITIAPHLYDWYLDGQDDYIDIPETTVFASPHHTIITRAFIHIPIQNDFTWTQIVGARSPTVSYNDELLVRKISTTLYLNYHTQDTNKAGSISTTIQKDQWYTIYAGWNTTNTFLLLDTNLIGTVDIASPNIIVDDATISNGNLGFYGKLSYVILYNKTKTTIETIENTDLNMFLDPTFYNGVKYIDISGSGNNGSPYGGISRVPADQKWLWCVVGSGGDGFVHLRFVPVGSHVSITSVMDGRVIADFVVPDWLGNLVGLAEDIPLYLEDGEYNVTITIPDVWKGLGHVLFSGVSNDFQDSIYHTYDDGIVWFEHYYSTTDTNVAWLLPQAMDYPYKKQHVISSDITATSENEPQYPPYLQHKENLNNQYMTYSTQLDIERYHILNQTSIQQYITLNQTNIEPYIKLEQNNITLQAGTTIAPHLYNWYFDGEDDHVSYNFNPFPLTGTELSVAIRQKMSKSIKTWAGDIVYDGVIEHWTYDDDGLYYRIHVTYVNATEPPFANALPSLSTAHLHIDEWHEGALIVWKETEWNYMKIEDGVITNGSISYVSTSDYPYVLQPFTSRTTGTRLNYMSIPTNYNIGMHGFISYVFLSNSKQTTSITRHIITKTNTTVLLDPTFYDGAYYREIINTTIAGMSYGGTKRIPANQTWLWIIKEVYTDNYLHIRFVPNGTIVRIVDTVTGEEWSYTVTGSPNGAGLIEDYTILPPTTNPINITTFIPKQITIAPHLYDWYAIQNDNLNDNVFFEADDVVIDMPYDIEFSFDTSLNMADDWFNTWYFIVRLYNETGAESGRVGLHGWGNKWELDWFNTTDYRFGVTFYATVKPTSIKAHLENGFMMIQDDVSSNNNTNVYENLRTNVKNIRIYLTASSITTTGFSYWNKISHLYLHNNITKILLDPTFYNGTHYLSLNKKMRGTPYYVSRVPADEKWLWSVDNYVSGDEYIHVRFVPNGTIVKIKDTVTGEEWSYTVTGTPNGAGLIEDYTILPPTTNPINITTYIPKQITIAPHLYDWSLDGVDDYVKGSISVSSSSVTIETRGLILGDNAYPDKNKHVLFSLFDVTSGARFYFRTVGYDDPWDWQLFFYNTSRAFSIVSGVDGRSSYYTQTGILDYTIMKYYLNGNLVNSKSIDNSGFTFTTYYVGYYTNDELLNGRVSFARVYNHVLSDAEISNAYNNHVIIKNNLVLFLDPTFFNGTMYIDLSGNNNHGTPYGGVQRVPSEEKWLWSVDDYVSGDNYLHIRFVPNGTIVRIVDTVTGEEWEYTVTGTPNGAGLIEDYTILPPTTNPINITTYIPKQITIAPHLYDWSLDGVDDYVKVNDSPSLDTNVLSVSLAFHEKDNGDDTLVQKYLYSSYAGWRIRKTDTVYGIYVLNTTGSYNLFWVPRDSGHNDNITLTINAPTKEIGFFVNGVKQLSATLTIDGDIYSSIPLYIGSYTTTSAFYRGTISYLIQHNRVITGTEINNTILYHAVSGSSLVLFLDASFYNGTHYLDLSDYGNDGTPNGGVARVPADSVWVWRLVDVVGDGVLHFRFVPYGTIVVFDNGTSAFSITIDGSPNDAGLVEDFVFDPPFVNGVYNVTFYFPANTTYTLAKMGARDGEAGGFGIGDGVYNAGLLGDYSGYVFSNPRKQLGADTVFSIEYRVLFDRLDGYWNITVPELNTLVSVSNGTVFLDVNGANTIGSWYPEKDIWYLLDIVYGDGWVAVAVAPSDYGSGGGYDGLVVIANVSITSVMDNDFHVTETIHDSLVYVDWYRVRLFSIVNGEGYTGVPYMTENREAFIGLNTGFSYNADSNGVLLYVLGDHGWMELVPVYSNSRFDMLNTVYYKPSYGLGSTWNDSPSGVGVFINGSLYTVVPISSYMKVLSRVRSDHDYIGVITIDDVLGNDTIVPSIGVIRSVIAKHFYGFPFSSLSLTIVSPFIGSSVVESKEQVAPITYTSPNQIYSLAIIGYNGTMSGSNTTVRLIANVTSRGITLEVWKNDTLLAKGKEMAYRSPMFLEIGFNYDDLKKDVTVYGMVAYTITQGDNVYTVYDTDYISYTEYSEPSLSPYIQSRSDITFSADRFALTLGDGEYYKAIGKIVMNIIGAIPMTGLIKYVSVNEPVTIQNLGSTISVLSGVSPSGASMTLKGFKGWSLTLGIYGTTVSGITITSDEYPVDFPLGFTAVIVADLSTRTVSITGATPPPTVVEVTPQQPETPVYNPPSPPDLNPDLTRIKDSDYFHYGLTMMMIITAVLIYSLNRNLSAGLILGGLLGFILTLALQDIGGMGISLIIVIIGLFAKQIL